MNDAWTVKSVLDWATGDFAVREMESPRLEAELLLSTVLSCERIKLYTEFDRPLQQAELSSYREMIARRRKGEPAAYITGLKEFWSLEFEVGPSVLVPRPDTETLVQAALDRGVGLRLLDLCTGSGCVGQALASEAAGLRVEATDLSSAACEVARRNAHKHDMSQRVTILEGDLFGPLEKGALYDTIVSNPPYVIDEEIAQLSPEVRSEPMMALAGGNDGLDVVRRILAGAPEFLAPGGSLLLEIDPRQATVVAEDLGRDAIGRDGEIVKDMAGRDRVVAFTVPD